MKNQQVRSDQKGLFFMCLSVDTTGRPIISVSSSFPSPSFPADALTVERVAASKPPPQVKLPLLISELLVDQSNSFVVSHCGARQERPRSRPARPMWLRSGFHGVQVQIFPPHNLIWLPAKGNQILLAGTGLSSACPDRHWQA